MELQDLKLLGINSAALALSFSNIEMMLKIILLLVSIGYTISKWKDLKK